MNVSLKQLSVLGYTDECFAEATLGTGISSVDSLPIIFGWVFTVSRKIIVIFSDKRIIWLL